MLSKFTVTGDEEEVNNDEGASWSEEDSEYDGIEDEHEFHEVRIEKYKVIGESSRSKSVNVDQIKFSGAGDQDTHSADELGVDSDDDLRSVKGSDEDEEGLKRITLDPSTVYDPELWSGLYLNSLEE